MPKVTTASAKQIERFAAILTKSDAGVNWDELLTSEKVYRDMLNTPVRFPKTNGLPAGTHWAFVVALHNKNWDAALAMCSRIKLAEIERDLRLQDEDDSILDGVAVKAMPKKLKQLCKDAVATVNEETTSAQEQPTVRQRQSGVGDADDADDSALFSEDESARQMPAVVGNGGGGSASWLPPIPVDLLSAVWNVLVFAVVQVALYKPLMIGTSFGTVYYAANPGIAFLAVCSGGDLAVTGWQLLCLGLMGLQLVTGWRALMIGGRIAISGLQKPRKLQDLEWMWPGRIRRIFLFFVALGMSTLFSGSCGVEWQTNPVAAAALLFIIA
jgi:hypothetical protein